MEREEAASPTERDGLTRPRTSSYLGYGSWNSSGIGSLNSTHNGLRGGNVDSSGSGYEEFFRGSVPCPSCRGLGRIRKEDENQLVAIIPMKDKRLKPRRTYLYVVLAILACVLVAGLTLFFMFPRSVVAISNQPYLEPNHLYINKTRSLVNFTITNRYNFSNANYFGVMITYVQAAVMYDMKVLSVGKNSTTIEIPMRSTREQYVDINLILQGDEGYLVNYCLDHRKWVHDLFMQFDLTANYSYLGRTEQTTLTTYQHVSCGNNTSV